MDRWKVLKLVAAVDAGAELCSLQNDPMEYHNLANDAALTEHRAKLKAPLEPVTANLHDSGLWDHAGD